MKDPQGNSLRSDREVWGHLCINSPYRNFVFEHIKELVSNYPIDGIFLDMIIYHWTILSCYCYYCERKFMRELGYELPKEPDWGSDKWRRFIKWRYRCIEQFIEEARNIVKSIRKECAFVHNYHGYFAFNWRIGQTAGGGTRYVDYCTGEAYPDTFGYLCPSELAKFLKGVSGGKPAEVIVYRHTGGWDYSIKAKEQIKWEIATIIANGCAATIVDAPYPDGSLEKEVYHRIGEIFSEVKRRKEFLLGVEPIKYAALYYSQNTKDFYARDELARYIPFFNGAYKILVESHIPFEIVSDRHLMNLDKLKEYRVLILPNSVCLSDRQCDVIRDFFKSGKGIVATYLTSMSNEEGEFRDNFLLSDVLGCDFLRISEYSNGFILPLEDSLTEGVDKIPQLHKGPLIKVKNNGGKVLAKIIDPVGEFISGRTYSLFPAVPGNITDYPAIITNERGESRSVYIAGAFEYNYARFSYPNYRKLLINSILWVAKEDPVIRVEAPLTVEATFFKKDNNFIVHLVNYHLQKMDLSPITLPFSQLQNPPVPLIEETIPIYNVKVKVRGSVKRAYLISSKTDLPMFMRRCIA
ncbi:hypothetical protein HRbin06_01062 [archaeon HR06]|nr:hypothetical protein HRbin06_01062 [archaeon HR06]